MGGYAPGWQIRCCKCGRTREAAAVGIVRVGAASFTSYTLGWCSHCRWLRILAIEPALAAAARKPAGVVDPDFRAPDAVKPTSWRSLMIRFAWVAACLYLPFAWLPLALRSGGGSYSLGWFGLWPILPGFVPAAWLLHPYDGPMFIAMGATTLGLLAGLGWLARPGGWRFGLAVLLALIVSIPSSQIAYACFAY